MSYSTVHTFFKNIENKEVFFTPVAVPEFLYNKNLVVRLGLGKMRRQRSVGGLS